MKIAGRKIQASAFAFPLLLCAILVGAWLERDFLFSIFASRERLRSAVESSGVWGPLVFIALQAVQVVVFIIPGEIAQIAGGYLFGVLHGTLLSAAGIAFGSLLDFAAARLLGKGFVKALFGEEKLERFATITTSRRAEAVFFLFFLIPGIPKDLLCYVAGLSSMRPLVFLAVSMVGRLPGIVGSAVMGEAAADGRGGLFVGVAIVASVLFIAGLLGHDRIHAVLASFAHPRRDPPIRKTPEERSGEEPARLREEDGTPRRKDT